MIESTFQLGPGLGPGRERKLWRGGFSCWRDLSDAAPAVTALTPSEARKLLPAVEAASEAFAAHDARRLGRLIPMREHWRLFEAFSEDAVYLDIETSDDVVGYAGISAIGLLDHNGPRQLLAGRNLKHFPSVARDWKMLVTFNGLSFDVPVLRNAFPDWEPPACHIDLRHVLARLGYKGGLKSIERELARLNLARPPHLADLGGWDTGWLYRRGRDGDREAMRRFAEYNLYDAINLRTLMAFAFNEMVAAETVDAPAVRQRVKSVAVRERGDCLYDVSKILLAI